MLGIHRICAGGLISAHRMSIILVPAVLRAPRTVAHSSRGPGRRPLTPVTRVRIPYALPTSLPSSLSSLSSKLPLLLRCRGARRGRSGRVRYTYRCRPLPTAADRMRRRARTNPSKSLEILRNPSKSLEIHRPLGRNEQNPAFCAGGSPAGYSLPVAGGVSPKRSAGRRGRTESKPADSTGHPPLSAVRPRLLLFPALPLSSPRFPPFLFRCQELVKNRFGLASSGRDEGRLLDNAVPGGKADFSAFGRDLPAIPRRWAATGSTVLRGSRTNEWQEYPCAPSSS